MNARTMGWIGYDWFKLVVAIILILLLLWLALAAGSPAASVPAPAAATAAAPAAPALTAPALLSPAAGSTLQPGTVTFSGTAAPGSTVQITIDGKPAGTATADAGGTWSLDAAIDTAGEHAVVAQALDGKGAVAAEASPLSLNVGAPAPALAAPVLSVPAAGAALQAGTVTFSGTAAPGSTVQITIDGKPAGTATADAGGTWSLDAAIDTAGEHAVVAQALDDKGAVAAEASPLSLNVGAPTQVAAAPTIDAPASANAGGPLTISGTGTPGSEVEILIDGQVAGKATVGADGTWSFEANAPDGEHEVVARAIDASGAASSPITLTWGGAAPAAGAAPAIQSPADGAQLGSEPFTMTGTGAPGATIEILDSDKVIGTATVGADGSWSVPITPGAGTAAYSARAAGTTDVTAKPIRVTFGTPQAQACSALAINCDAWVTRAGGLSLRMRAGAGTGQRILTKLPVGTQLTLLEGPQPASGRSWWRVRTLGGQVGWVAGEELVLQPD